jgi:PAS domain S-box-containing protein
MTQPPQIAPRHPLWTRKWVPAAGVAVAALAIGLHVLGAVLGDTRPWVAAIDLVSDALLIVVAIGAVVWFAMSAEARAARARAETDEAQARLAAVIDSAMDAIVSVDEEQHIALFNRAAEKVFGYSQGEALGMPLENLLPSRYRAAHRAHIERFGQTGTTTRLMGDATVLWGLRASGEEFPIEASISHLNEHGRHFYTVILRDVTLRKQYEDRLLRQQGELRELSAQVLEAREEEKTRIARELHDELGQLLSALKMDLAWLHERLPAAGPEALAKAEQMSALLDETVGSVRRIASDLRPLMLDDLGFLEAAGWLIEDFSRRSGVQCRFDSPTEAELADLERGVATTLYRALQESLTNIARHAQATNAWIMLGADREALRLEIEDDGRGIDAEDLAKLRSLGLRGMRERVQYVGGSLEIGRAPRGGTRIQLRVPLRASQERAA